MPSLESLKSLLSEFFKTQPVIKAWIFGSYARGEQKSGSDIDILVDFDPDNYPGLLTHVGMIQQLEKQFHTKIDIVPRENLFPRVRKEIEKDKILVYERI